MVGGKKGPKHSVVLSLAKTGIEHPFLTEKFKFKDHTREFEPIAAVNVSFIKVISNSPFWVKSVPNRIKTDSTTSPLV